MNQRNGERTRAEVRRLLAALSVTALLLLAGRAHAEPDTFHQRSVPYWLGHSGIAAGSLLLNVIWGRVVPYGAVNRGFGNVDRCERGQQSNTAEGLSSGLAMLQLVEPVPAWASQASAPHFFHATFVYGQALSVSTMLSTLASHVRRPRPDTWADPDHQPDCSHLPESACQSFYSARASAAFAGAFSGSYVFSELYKGSSRNGVTGVAWGMQLGLAALTTGLQVKGGQAFWTDALIGAGTGTVIGGGLYLAHSGSLAMSRQQALGAGIGLLSGTIISAVFPTGKTGALAPFGITAFDAAGVGVALQGEL